MKYWNIIIFLTNKLLKKLFSFHLLENISIQHMQNNLQESLQTLFLSVDDMRGLIHEF